MKTRQHIGACHVVTVPVKWHRVVVRFRPDQRKLAKLKLIRGCFGLGYVIPLDHPAFAEIDQHTWRQTDA